MKDDNSLAGLGADVQRDGEGKRGEARAGNDGGGMGRQPVMWGEAAASRYLRLKTGCSGGCVRCSA